MVNKSVASKEFKKLCDKTIVITKEEIKTAKHYSKLWNNYSTINDSINENVKRLISANLLLEKRKQNVETLEQMDRDRENELDHVKEEIKTYQEKISAIHNSDSKEAKQINSVQLILLRLNVLKSWTKTYINDKMLPHAVRGFTGNEDTLKTIPFEVDPARLSEDDVQNALWENCLKSSPYAKEWSNIFIVSTEPMDT